MPSPRSAGHFGAHRIFQCPGRARTSRNSHDSPAQSRRHRVLRRLTTQTSATRRYAEPVGSRNGWRKAELSDHGGGGAGHSDWGGPCRSVGQCQHCWKAEHHLRTEGRRTVDTKTLSPGVLPEMNGNQRQSYGFLVGVGTALALIELAGPTETVLIFAGAA